MKNTIIFLCIVIIYSQNLHIYAQHTQDEKDENLVLHLPFDNDEAFTAYETVSKTRTSKPNSGAYFLEDGLYLDGTDDDLTVPKSEITKISGTAISIAIWAKLDNIKSTNSLLSKFFTYELKVTDGHLELSLMLDGFTKFRAKTTQVCIQKDQLHHIVAVRNQADIIFYVDGKTIHTEYIDERSDKVIYPANNDIYIGSAKGKEYVNGIIYDAKVYGLALNNSDIHELMVSSDKPDLPPLIDAGANLTFVSPATNITLAGKASDQHGEIITTSWKQTYGKAVNLNNSTIHSLKTGEYRFEFSATDNGGNTASDELVIWCFDSSSQVSFVSTEGNDDTGNGSKANPYQSVNKAIENRQGSAEHTVFMMPGNYTFQQIVNIPDNVNLLGAGETHTQINAVPELFYDSGLITKSLIQISNVKQGNRIGYFSIDGTDKQLNIGILIKDAENVQLQNVSVSNTFFAGIALAHIKNSIIHHINLTNTSWGSNDYSSGAISMGDAENVDLFNINISEGLVDLPEKWGYGIKAYQIDGSKMLKKVRIYNSHIETRNEGFWNNGEAPNIAIEFHSTSFDSCEIFNVVVNNTISLAPNKFTEGSKNIRLHHCKIHGPKGVPIESYMKNCEIDHNYIIGEYTTIKGFNNNTYSDYLVHHNVFTDQYPKTGHSQCMSFGALENVKFYNNTCYFTQYNNVTILELFAASESSNFDVANNIFFTTQNTGNSKVIGLKNDASVNTTSLKNNILYNYESGITFDTESGNSNLDPQIEWQNSPVYFVPVATAETGVVDAGIDVGLPYRDAAPDIGAGENKVGYGISPQIQITNPMAGTVVPVNVELNIEVEASNIDTEIDRIELYSNDKLLQSSRQSSFTAIYTPKRSGKLMLKALAYDSDGMVTQKWYTLTADYLVTGVDILPDTSLNLTIGEQFILTAKITPENAVNKSLTWSSSNPQVISVDENGLVTALNQGTATISTTTDEGRYTDDIVVNAVISSIENYNDGKLKLNVYPNPVSNSKLYLSSTDFNTGEIYHISVFNSLGQQVFQTKVTTNNQPVEIDLPRNITKGI